MSAKWWTLMMASVMPKVRRRLTVISRSERPLISTRAFGRVSVRGRRRVPRPAARIMAFIEVLSCSGTPVGGESGTRHLHRGHGEQKGHTKDRRTHRRQFGNAARARRNADERFLVSHSARNDGRELTLGGSFAEVFQAEVAELDFYARLGAQASG